MGSLYTEQGHNDNIKQISRGRFASINRMQAMLGNLMVWKGMMRDIREYVRSCHLCQVSKSKACMFSAPWQDVLPASRGELIAVDVFGPLVKIYTGILAFL